MGRVGRVQIKNKSRWFECIVEQIEQFFKDESGK